MENFVNRPGIPRQDVDNPPSRHDRLGNNRFVAGIAATVMLLATLPAGAQLATKDRGEMAKPVQVRLKSMKAPRIEIRAKDAVAHTFVPRKAPTNGMFVEKSATFAVTYIGFSPAAEAAFQYAVDIWSQLITSAVTININATWGPLGEGVLGSAGANQYWYYGPQQYIFPDALVDALVGADQGGGAADIVATFNSNFGDWYLGTDGNPPAGKYDLVSVVLHEIGHGLGFLGLPIVDDGADDAECNGTAGIGCWLAGPTNPGIFDIFTEDNLGNALLNQGLFPDNSFQLGNVLTGMNVFFDGTGARAGNGGNPPELYAPGTWDGGSSYAHLDEAVFPAGNPNSLMTPFLASAEAIHNPGLITLGIFSDMGWTVADPPIFSDGFESGGTGNWTSTVGGL